MESSLVENPVKFLFLKRITISEKIFYCVYSVKIRKHYYICIYIVIIYILYIYNIHIHSYIYGF